MAFGFEGHEQKHWSRQNLEIAIQKLQEEAPSFGAEGNTKKVDEKYFVMGLEVYEPEYNTFMATLDKLMDHVIEHKKNKLDKAA